jgi:hypothetical protein
VKILTRAKPKVKKVEPLEGIEILKPIKPPKVEQIEKSEIKILTKAKPKVQRISKNESYEIRHNKKPSQNSSAQVELIKQKELLEEIEQMEDIQFLKKSKPVPVSKIQKNKPLSILQKPKPKYEEMVPLEGIEILQRSRRSSCEPKHSKGDYFSILTKKKPKAPVEFKVQSVPEVKYTRSKTKPKTTSTKFLTPYLVYCLRKCFSRTNTETFNRLKKMPKKIIEVEENSEAELYEQFSSLIQRGAYRNLRKKLVPVRRRIKLFYLLNVLRINKEWAKMRYKHKILFIWTLYTKTQMKKRLKMKSMYENMNKLYLQMADSLFGNNQQNNPSIQDSVKGYVDSEVKGKISPFEKMILASYAKTRIVSTPVIVKREEGEISWTETEEIVSESVKGETVNKSDTFRSGSYKKEYMKSSTVTKTVTKSDTFSKNMKSETTSKALKSDTTTKNESTGYRRRKK